MKAFHQTYFRSSRNFIEHHHSLKNALNRQLENLIEKLRKKCDYIAMFYNKIDEKLLYIINNNP